jgi:hypothetical protein
MGYPRLEITWSAIASATTTAPFQILVPVAINGDDTHKAVIFMATVDGNATGHSPTFFSKGRSGEPGTYVNSAPTFADAHTIRVNLQAADKMATATNRALQIKSNSADFATAKLNKYVDTTVANAFRIHAGVQYCAAWNWYNGASLGSNLYGAASNGEDKCLTYALPLVDGTPAKTTTPFSATPTRWCMFCPISKDAAISSAQDVVTITGYIPWNGGRSWTANNVLTGYAPQLGCLYVGADTFSTILACDDGQNEIAAGTITAGSISPANLNNNTVSTRVTIPLTLTNILPTVIAPRVADSATYQIYIKQSAALFAEESQASARVQFGSDRINTVSASFEPEIAGDTYVSGTQKAALVSFTAAPPVASAAITIILDGIYPKALTATTATLNFYSRIEYANDAATVAAELDASAAVTYTIGTSAANNLVPDLSGALYTNPVRAARGALKIPFKPAARDILNEETFVINFVNANLTNAASGNNDPTRLICEVCDGQNNLVTTFKSCAITTDTITLVAQADITISAVQPFVLIRGFTTVDFNSTSLTSKLTSKSGSTIQPAPSTAPAPTTYFAQSNAHTGATFAAADLAVARFQNQVGGTSTIQITIKNGAGALTSNGRILVEFPYYYTSRLGNYRDLVVRVNNVSTAASIIDHRLLQIPLPAAVANGANITLRIYGVSVPKYSTAGSFWVAIDTNSAGNDGYAQIGTVADVAAIADAVIPALWVSNLQFWIGNNAALPQTRSVGNLNLTVVFRKETVANSILVVDIPASWMDLVLASPTLSAALSYNNGTAGSTIGATPLETQANLLRFNLTVAFAVNSQINISISNMRTPDNGFGSANCINESPRIAVFNADETSLIARSSPSNSQFSRDITLASYDISILNFPDRNRDRPIRLPQGTAQTRDDFFTLNAGTSAFSKSITATIASAASGVQIIPGTGVSMVGDQNLVFGLQALGNAVLGLTNVVFSKVETALPGGTTNNVYAPLPTLRVLVTNDKAVPNAPSGPILVPLNGNSVPIIYSYSHAPSADVTFDVKGNDSSIAVVNVLGAPTSTFTIPAGMNRFAVVVNVLSSAVVGNNYVLYVAPGTNPTSSNPAFINLPQNVTITVTAAQTDSPTLALSADPTNADSGPLQQVINVRIGTSNTSATVVPPVTLFWTCSHSSLMVNRDLSIVKTFAANPPVNQTGEVFGWRAVPSPSLATPESIVVRGLMANSNYNCRFWAINQGNMNTSNSTPITTASNGGRLARINVEYDAAKYEGAATITATLCWISTFLSAPPRLVRALSGEICGGAGVFQPVFPAVNISNTTSVVTVPIYFIPNNALADDKLSAQASERLPANVAPAKTAASSINRFTGFLNLNTTVPVYSAPNVVNATSTAPLTVTFTAPTNNTASIAWVGVWSWTNTSSNPDWSVFNPFAISSTRVAVGATYFNGTVFNPATISLNITWDSNTNYALFWAATCENPSEHAGACAGPIGGPIPVSNSPPPVDPGPGTTNARVLSIGFTFVVALLLSLLI